MSSANWFDVPNTEDQQAAELSEYIETNEDDENESTYCGSIRRVDLAAHAAECAICHKDFLERGLIDGNASV